MKNIVITGASRRLGLFLVEKFSKAGNHVFAITRNQSPELEALAGNSVEIIQVKEYSAKSAEMVSSIISSKTDRIDLLVNNASAFCKDAEGDDLVLMEIFYTVHMLFPYVLTRSLEGKLEDKQVPGVVVNITDIYAENPNEEFLLYCSTKAGLSNLTLGLAKRYAGKIRVMGLAPGPIKFLPEHTTEDKKKVMSQTLIGSEGGFLPVLKSINFICDNEYLTGSIIKVDGGRSISNW